GPVPVELRRIVRDGEVDLQDPTIADALRIKTDADGFGVAGRAGTDRLVLRGSLLAAGVAGHSARHAIDVLEHALHAPETAACQHGGLARRTGRRRFVCYWRGHD